MVCVDQGGEAMGSMMLRMENSQTELCKIKITKTLKSGDSLMTARGEITFFVT